jgi:hypothetical protein
MADTQSADTQSADTQSADESVEQDVRFIDAAPALEFMCWVVVALAPFLRWVNGPAVTSDQFAIQVALVTLAGIGAISLRVYRIVANRR